MPPLFNTVQQHHYATYSDRNGIFLFFLVLLWQYVGFLGCPESLCSLVIASMHLSSLLISSVSDCGLIGIFSCDQCRGLWFHTFVSPCYGISNYCLTCGRHPLYILEVKCQPWRPALIKLTARLWRMPEPWLAGILCTVSHLQSSGHSMAKPLWKL